MSLTSWKQHLRDWKKCECCGLSKYRTHPVFFRYAKLSKSSEAKTEVIRQTSKPRCDILIVGEAPGESEDLHGKPFVGPSGHLLNKMLLTAYNLFCDEYHHPHDWAFEPVVGITNIVSCIPMTENDAGFLAVREPTKAEALTCRPRLQQLIDLACPTIIVSLGAVAKKFLPPTPECHHFNLRHPSYILRQESENRSAEEIGMFEGGLIEIFKTWKHHA